MKRMYTLITILIVFLGVAFFTNNGGNGLSLHQKPKVGVLTLMHHPAQIRNWPWFFPRITQRLIKSIKASGMN